MSTVELTKGGNVSLTKDNPGLSKLVAGAGWDVNQSNGSDFDLDLSLVAVKSDGKVRDNNDLIYFRKLAGVSGAVKHTGDNLTGEGTGDDEQIKIDLAATPADIEKLILFINIYQAEERHQNFGQVNNAFVRIVNQETNEELVKYDLSEDFSTETSVVMGELYRHDGGWKFKAVGQGYAGGLKAIASEHGVGV